MGERFDLRYLRQEILPEVGKEGQERLASARVLCIGAGGLGSPAALYLAAAGIGTLGIIDFDRIDASNLQRQILYREADTGKPKAEIAAQRISELNTQIKVKAYADRFSSKNAIELLKDFDLVLDGTDNFNAKYLINDAAARVGIPVVFGSISRWEGQVAVFWARRGPCYRCLYPEPPKTPVYNCAESGVMGAVGGIFGSLQALEAVKLLLSSSFSRKAHPAIEPLIGRMWTLDTLRMKSWAFQIPKRSGCVVCSRSSEEIELRDQDLTGMLCPEAHTGEKESRVDQRTVLIDVREGSEWQDGHIANAIHWPLSKILADDTPLELEDLKKKADIVLYCASGMRSFHALQVLKDRGWENLRHLENGLQSWKGALIRE